MFSKQPKKYESKSFDETFAFESDIKLQYPDCTYHMRRTNLTTAKGSPKLITVKNKGETIAVHRAIELISMKTGRPYVVIVKEIAKDFLEPWAEDKPKVDTDTYDDSDQ